MADLRTADARYSGQSGEILSLAFRTGMLTLLTLGIYRFWAKTRIRRYIWSSIYLDGGRFEYTGTGLEKFLGFLIAVVILAVYLGLIQMGLFFFGLTLFVAPQSEEQAIAQVSAINLSLLAVLPLIYFAVYRARRYKLARTRWRGIRFGMEKGAWGYAARAIGYGVLTIVSLGLLLPLATFRLEKYMTDRSWFGDAPFVQEGRWQELYPAMKHVFIALGLLALAAVLLVQDLPGPGVALVVAGSLWFVIGAVNYSVQSFAYLARHKRLGEDITFEANPRTATIILSYLVGAIAVSVLTGIALALLGVIVGAEVIMSPQLDEFATPGIGAIVLGIVGYLLILVAAGAAWMALVVQPILAHYVTALSVVNADGFNSIAQRARDTGADAEGFADALDIGGAI